MFKRTLIFLTNGKSYSSVTYLLSNLMQVIINDSITYIKIWMHWMKENEWIYFKEIILLPLKIGLL